MNFLSVLDKYDKSYSKMKFLSVLDKYFKSYGNINAIRLLFGMGSYQIWSYHVTQAEIFHFHILNVIVH